MTVISRAEREQDEAMWSSPIHKLGMDRQNWAVETLRKKGGQIYFPETSNFMPKYVGFRLNVHSHVWVGDDVMLTDDMKIQAFCFIPNGVVFAPRVFLGPRVTFTNDKRPPNNLVRSTFVGLNAAIGAGAVIVCGVEIGEGALIGAGAVVTRDVPAGQVWVGNPARPIKSATYAADKETRRVFMGLAREA